MFKVEGEGERKHLVLEEEGSQMKASSREQRCGVPLELRKGFLGGWAGVNRCAQSVTGQELERRLIFALLCREGLASSSTACFHFSSTITGAFSDYTVVVFLKGVGCPAPLCPWDSCT
jgi:hypothetical protein